MKVSKSDIEEVIEKLQCLVNEMEKAEIDEISTDCNTYGLYDFISFGSRGYLTLDSEELDRKVAEESYED